MTKEQAFITLQHLGGIAAVKAMTGTKQFIYSESGVSFIFSDIKGEVHGVCIGLKNDLYTLEYRKSDESNILKEEPEIVEEGIWAENLKSEFEAITGFTLTVPWFVK